jgi:hypothetical protein
MGAVVDPWVDPDRLARELCMTAMDLRGNWHAFVSGDPSVAIAGTPLPDPADPTAIPTRPLHEIQCAVGAALRIPASRLREHSLGARLFLALAREQGWTDNARLGAAIGISVRNARRVAPISSSDLEAARLCLGDRRLWAAFEHDPPRTRDHGRRLGAPYRDPHERRVAQPNT